MHAALARPGQRDRQGDVAPRALRDARQALHQRPLRLAIRAGLMQSQVIVNAHVHLHPERLAEAIWRWFDTHAWHICSTGPREWLPKGHRSRTDFSPGSGNQGLRGLLVIESGARTRSRTLSVLTACEYRSCLTQQRVCAGWPRRCDGPPLLHAVARKEPLLIRQRVA